MSGASRSSGQPEGSGASPAGAAAPDADTPSRTGADGPDNGAPGAGKRTRSSGSLLRRLAQVEALPVLLATVVLALVVGFFRPAFWSTGNIHDLLQQSVYVALLAAGLSFLIGMREIDLSVGSMYALSLIIAALLIKDGVNPWLAAAIAIALGGVMGLFNAVLVQGIAIPAIIATLATLSMFRGLALALTDAQQVTGLPRDNSFFTILSSDALGVPVTVWIMVAMAIVLTAVLRLTPYGYRVRSIGSNPEAATFSGISIPRVRIQALVIMGLLAGLAGVLGLSFFQTGDPNIGLGFEFQAIAAAVIGGTPLNGGRATVAGAMVGAVLLSVVTNGLVFFDVPVNWSQFATGAVILAAVSLDSLVRRRRIAAESGVSGSIRA